MAHDLSADLPEPLLNTREILGVLWRRKYIVVLSVVAVVSIALAYMAVVRPTYTSRAVLLVDPRETNTTKTPNVISGIGSDSAAVASQVSVIRSNALLGAVFQAENVASDIELTRKGLLSGILSAFGGANRPVTEQAAFEAFKKRVLVDREGLTYVLNIRYGSRDPDKAARYVNAIVNQYISGQVTEKSDASQEVTTLLNGRIARLREAVSESEQAVQKFRADNDIVDLGAGRTLLNTQIEQLNGQLLQAQKESRDAANRYKHAVAIGTSPEGLARLTEFLASKSAERLRNTYNLRVSALAKAESDLGAQHPSLLRLKAEVAHLRGLIRKEAQRIIAELRASKELTELDFKAIQFGADRLAAKVGQIKSAFGSASPARTQCRRFTKGFGAVSGKIERDKPAWKAAAFRCTDFVEGNAGDKADLAQTHVDSACFRRFGPDNRLWPCFDAGFVWFCSARTYNCTDDHDRAAARVARVSELSRLGSRQRIGSSDGSSLQIQNGRTS